MHPPVMGFWFPYPGTDMLPADCFLSVKRNTERFLPDYGYWQHVYLIPHAIGSKMSGMQCFFRMTDPSGTDTEAIMGGCRRMRNPGPFIFSSTMTAALPDKPLDVLQERTFVNGFFVPPGHYDSEIRAPLSCKDQLFQRIAIFGYLESTLHWFSGDLIRLMASYALPERLPYPQARMSKVNVDRSFCVTGQKTRWSQRPLTLEKITVKGRAQLHFEYHGDTGNCASDVCIQVRDDAILHMDKSEYPCVRLNIQAEGRSQILIENLRVTSLHLQLSEAAIAIFAGQNVIDKLHFEAMGDAHIVYSSRSLFCLQRTVSVKDIATVQCLD